MWFPYLDQAQAGRDDLQELHRCGLRGDRRRECEFYRVLSFGVESLWGAMRNRLCFFERLPPKRDHLKSSMLSSDLRRLFLQEAGELRTSTNVSEIPGVEVLFLLFFGQGSLLGVWKRHPVRAASPTKPSSTRAKRCARRRHRWIGSTEC